MKFLLIVTFLLMVFYSHAQSEMIKLPAFFDGNGVKFSKENQGKLSFQNIGILFTPSESDIISFESTLKYFSFKDTNLKRFYYRQYVGFLKEDKKYLLIHMMNFKKRKLALQNFNGWENDLVIGLGDFYEKNSSIYKYDINEKLIGIY